MLLKELERLPRSNAPTYRKAIKQRPSSRAAREVVEELRAGACQRKLLLALDGSFCNQVFFQKPNGDVPRYDHPVWISSRCCLSRSTTTLSSLRPLRASAGVSKVPLSGPDGPDYWGAVL